MNAEQDANYKRQAKNSLLFLGALGVLTAGFPGPTTGQTSNQELCPGCAPLVSHTVRLIIPERLDALAATTYGVIFDSQNRYWLTVANTSNPLLYRDTGTLAGEFTARPEGWEGEPIRAMAAFADSTLLFARSGAFVVGPSLEISRRIVFPHAVFGAVPLDWPRFALNAVVRTSSAIGHPFHILNGVTGRIERSFGGTPDFRPSDLMQLVATLRAQSREDGLLTMHRSDPVLRRWTFSGEPAQLSNRELALFDPVPEVTAGGPDEPPTPLVAAFVKRRSSVVVHYALPRQDWRSAWNVESDHQRSTPINRTERLWSPRIALIPDGSDHVEDWDSDFYGLGFFGPASALVGHRPDDPPSQVTVVHIRP